MISYKILYEWIIQAYKIWYHIYIYYIILYILYYHHFFIIFYGFPNCVRRWRNPTLLPQDLHGCRESKGDTVRRRARSKTKPCCNSGAVGFLLHCRLPIEFDQLMPLRWGYNVNLVSTVALCLCPFVHWSAASLRASVRRPNLPPSSTIRLMIRILYSIYS